MTLQPLMFNTMSLDAIIPGWLGFILFCWFFSALMPCPGLPHSADNIQWVCMRVNLGKNKFSDEAFREWCCQGGFHLVWPSQQPLRHTM